MWRLALVMLFILAPLSSWYVTAGSYIAANTGASGSGVFSPDFIGKAYATFALGALVTPLVIGRVADRWIPANRLMTLINLVCAGLLWFMSAARNEILFWWLMLAYSLTFSPTITLANSVCFRHLANPITQFPRIRALATFSWVLGGWGVGYVAPWLLGYSIEQTEMPMQIGVTLHLVLACSCLILPHTTPANRKSRASWLQSLSEDARWVILEPRLFIPLLSATILSIAVTFYTNLVNVFLNTLGIQGAAGHLAWGQVSELFCLLLLPYSLRKLGIRWTLVTGFAAWTLRYLMLATAARGTAYWLIGPAILLHGVGYAFAILTIYMLTDRIAPTGVRAAAQGLVSMLTQGLGTLIGSSLTAICQARWLTTNADALLVGRWSSIWLLAAFIALLATVLILSAYKEAGHESPEMTTKHQEPRTKNQQPRTKN